MTLKTIKDLQLREGTPYWEYLRVKEVREEAIKIFKNLQSQKTIYPIILENFLESQKAEYAKDKWNASLFKYGAEYGMLSFILWFFNITDKELKYDATN